MINQYNIHIKGLVQGVGFRPFIYRLATNMHLHGYVDNRNDGVFVMIQATPSQKDDFVKGLTIYKPDVAEIENVIVDETPVSKPLYDFFIAPSREIDNRVTRISPDIAVCDECLNDLVTQPHRIGYPFINCTHCGPRFSIIKTLPYDRPGTTMSVFPMCPECEAEYTDVNNRRFHAQPVACNHCGPHYHLLMKNGYETDDYKEILSRVSACLRQEGVVALKGLGGFNLICNAASERAVLRLRKMKKRYKKPFAVMFPDIYVLSRYLNITPVEEKTVSSWRRPIVLLEEKKKIGNAINGGYHTVGAMLPYLPVHYHLFAASELETLVVTSGNRGDDPILMDNDAALSAFFTDVDLFVEHNRDISNRVDDSIVQIIGDQPRIIRRSRGFTPEPVSVNLDTEGILAFGAERVAMFALGKDKEIILSQYIGDLKNKETYRFYQEALDRFFTLFRFVPEYLVCDAHPDYFSTHLANRFARSLGIPLLRVQHHHAHAAAVMAEYGLTEDVIAVCLDGTGYGDDGCNWGGEVFRCNASRYERLAHLPYVPLPGGDAAARSPWRMAVSYMNSLYGDKADYPESFTTRIGESRIKQIGMIIEKGINTPFTSSTGRLFDAVASLLGICDENSYQAEAATLLEQIADRDISRCYPVDTDNPFNLRPLFDGILSDCKLFVPVSEIASVFHNTLSVILLTVIEQKMYSENLTSVVLSGGVFQNKRLTELLIKHLSDRRITYYLSSKIPCNDGAIAVGQMYIAAFKKRELDYA